MRSPVCAKNSGRSRTTAPSRLSERARARRPVPGQDAPHEEGAEHGVETDALGDPGRRERHEKEDREAVLRQAAAVPVDPPQPCEQRAGHDEHEEHEGGRSAQGQPERRRALRVPDQQDNPRQETPGNDVVHGRAGDRHGTDPRAQKFRLGQNAGQDRKRRHAHRRAEEERDCDAGGARERRRPAPPAQLADIQLGPDQEHEEDETDLAQGVQVDQACGRKERRRQGGGEPAEKRRTQQDAGGHLTHHAGLTDPREEEPDGARRQEYDDDLGQKERQVRHVGAHATLGRAGASSRGGMGTVCLAKAPLALSSATASWSIWSWPAF